MTNYNITVVDDYEDAIELMDYNLYKEGYQTRSFSNPMRALEFITPENTDLILTDWLMPEMNGIEFVKALKACSRTQDIPVIMVTCLNSEQNVDDAYKVGVQDFMTKPFRFNQLIRRIDQILKQKKQAS